MSESKKKTFSLYSWLLKKLCGKLFLWYFFTFISLFFYYQTTSYGLKQLWGYKAKPPFEIFFWEISYRENLIWYLFFTFFFIYLLTAFVCECLKNYSLELCRFHLRKLILSSSQKNPKRAKEYRKEIVNNFFGEVELFTPSFILVPHRIFSAIISVFLNFFFLTKLQREQSDISSNNFVTYFIIALSFFLIVISFLSYRLQTKINRRENLFRHQENILFEEYLEKQQNSQNAAKLINQNFQQVRFSLGKKAFSSLAYLIIPGFGILFCFFYSFWKNFKVEEFVEVGIIANSLQTIFFKVKDIVDNLPEISKGKIYYRSLEGILKKLVK